MSLLMRPRANAALDENGEHWIMTKGGTQALLDKDGNPIKGNPKVVEAMSGKGNDSAEDDVRSAVASMANIARMKSGAKVSYKITNGSMHNIAEIELEFSTPEEAKNYNYYYLFNEWQSSRKSILPKWAWGFGGYSVNVSGSKMKIHIAAFST